MSEPKTFASLGPTLLARKGGAKPAMRPIRYARSRSVTLLSLALIDAASS